MSMTSFWCLNLSIGIFRDSVTLVEVLLQEFGELRALHAFAPYVSSSLMFFRAYVPSRLTCFTHLPYLGAWRAFFKCLARMMCVA